MFENSGSTTSKSNEKMQFIARTALNLFVHQGYQATSVREIAKACNMTSGTLYYYIGVKENILSHLAAQDGAQIGILLETPRAAEDVVSSIKHAMERWYRYCDEWQDWVIVAHREIIYMPKDIQEQLFAQDRRTRAAFEALLAEAVRDGRMDVEDTTMLATDILALGQVWALRRWQFKRQYTLEQYVQRQIDVFIKSFQTDQPARSKVDALQK